MAPEKELKLKLYSSRGIKRKCNWNVINVSVNAFNKNKNILNHFCCTFGSECILKFSLYYATIIKQYDDESAIPSVLPRRLNAFRKNSI